MTNYDFIKTPIQAALMIVFFVLSLSAQAEGASLFDKVQVRATLSGQNMIFTVVNYGDKAVLIDDGFCLFDKVKTIVVTEPKFIPRKDYFESAMLHSQNRMLKLASGQSAECSIGYFKNGELRADEVGDGLIFWRINLFVGDIEGNYAGKKESGALSVSLPIGSSDMEPLPIIDEASLHSFLQRKALGVIENK